MPEAGPATRDHRAGGAGPRPAPRRLHPAEGASQGRRGGAATHERQGRTHTPPQRQPARPGLTLPKLTAPTSYTLSPDRIRNARLAHDLLDHQVIRAPDLDLNEPIPEAIAGALAKALTPRSGTRLHLTAHLARVADDHLRLYLVPELQAETFLNAHALTQQLDRLDANLAPSLLALVGRAHAITPCFTPAAAYEAVINLHWGGDDTGEEALEELRWQLAQERRVEPDEVPIEDAKALANEQFLTPDTLEARLPRRYLDASDKDIQTPEILARLDAGLFPGALGDIQELIHAANAAGRHGRKVIHHRLSDWDLDDLYTDSYPWYSYMVSITDPTLTQGPGGNELNDAVYEMLHEYDQYVMQGSMEPGPSAAFLIPHTPEGMQRLADLARNVRRQVALEARVYDLLAALVVKAGASEAERSTDT